VDLSYNPNITSIHFNRLWILSNSPQMHKAGIVEHLLARITSSEMQEVVMEISRGTVELLKEIDWNSIAKVLQRPNFSKLEKFVILGIGYEIESGNIHMNKAKDWMMQILPLGRARDKLLFEHKEY
jgi:hypothetical protein